MKVSGQLFYLKGLSAINFDNWGLNDGLYDNIKENFLDNKDKTFIELYKVDVASTLKVACFTYLYLTPNLKNLIDKYRDCQESIKGFAQQIRLAKELLEYMYDSGMGIPGIKEEIELLSAGDSIEDVLKERGVGPELIAKFEWLQDQLWEGRFDAGEPSYFSSSGHIILAYQYLCDPKIRALYANALDMVGEINCYVALAKKMNANKNKPNTQFCFVDFIERSDRPYLKMKGFWNPFISESVVVENDIELNGADGIRTAIITGPNTGGKSANTKAIMLSIALSQSFGIAAAKECEMTLFREMYMYANIKDDTPKKISLFKAAALRANTIVKRVAWLKDKSIKNNDLSSGFCICLMDELYTGTEPKSAAKAAKENILYIHECENCLLLGNTHISEIKELEKKHKGIANYMIDSYIDSETRRIKLSYKLKKGTSTINIAQQVIEDVEKELAKIDFDEESD